MNNNPIDMGYKISILVITKYLLLCSSDIKIQDMINLIKHLLRKKIVSIYI